MYHLTKRSLGSAIKRTLSLALCAALTVGGLGLAAGAEEEKTDFQAALVEQFADPDRSFQSDMRWWLPEASLTDEVLLEEVQLLYDAGFHGVELCMQSDNNSPDDVYAYGSEMWSHKWRLIMNALLDHGMSVSLTSGTNWSTSNVPGLDPDSQEASQVLAMGVDDVAAGEKLTALPVPSTTREKATFLGAYAFKPASYEVLEIPGRGSGAAPTTAYEFSVYADSLIDLSEKTEFVQGENPYEIAVDWTPEEDMVVIAYWTHGNYVTASPAMETCYATNYFDKRGVDALRTFWEANYLNDPELNEKIKNGDVQLFMDSLEINPTGGITWWTEDVRQEFIDRKGYDALPYLFLTENLPQVNAVSNPYTEPAKGRDDLEGDPGLREKIINDWLDVLTQLYEENMLLPLKEWLNSVGIETRAQISYGRSFEITEPSMYVDYPEAENLNQYDQIDILRLHTAGAKLQNKLLSTETGPTNPIHASNMQTRLKMVYDQYAAGFQRVIWHVWSSSWGFSENVRWPGNTPGFSMFDRWGDREMDAVDFDVFNAHVGRIQSLMQTGKARTDILFLHNNWNQGIRFGGGTADDITGMNWQLAHMGVYYRSTELQDNGYTYDYASPKLLFDDDVYFDEETKTIELAGYKAIVLYQDWLDVTGAERVLEWAKKGLPVVVLEGAAVRTPFNDGKDEYLAELMTELKALPNVREAEIYDAADDFNYFAAMDQGYSDGVLAAMQELGVEPYVGYPEANHQLLTQSRVDEDGNAYLYVYNYCSNDYHANSHIEAVKEEDHGTNIKTEIELIGSYIPYEIDAWTGKVTKLAVYRWEEGKTIIPVDLDYCDVALYAFEKAEAEGKHLVSTNAASAFMKDDAVVIRATESGEYTAVYNDEESKSVTVTVPEAYAITGWDLTVESWTPGEEKLTSTETIGDLTTMNTRPATIVTPITVQMDELTTWDNIPEIGQAVSGTGRYEASFNWDASAATGAYLTFSNDFISTMKVYINGQLVGGVESQNATKTPAGIAADSEGQVQYTGTINWMYPCADISEYLVDGENSIVIDYASTLSNVCLANGIVREAQNSQGWWGIHVQYESFGPTQAMIVPFVDSAF
ncbi:MAG: hypothetical protein IJ773_00720 [Lachnospiraceae bacterium]|nr:hypothetical protein [Lachnospiraceae bacterium]